MMNGRPNSSNAKDCAKLILADGLLQQEKAINQILADSTTTEKKGGGKPARPVQVKLMFSLQPPFLMSARRCACTSWEDQRARAYCCYDNRHGVRCATFVYTSSTSSNMEVACNNNLQQQQTLELNVGVSARIVCNVEHFSCWPPTLQTHKTNLTEFRPSVISSSPSLECSFKSASGDPTQVCPFEIWLRGFDTGQD